MSLDKLSGNTLANAGAKRTEIQTANTQVANDTDSLTKPLKAPTRAETATIAIITKSNQLIGVALLWPVPVSSSGPLQTWGEFYQTQRAENISNHLGMTHHNPVELLLLFEPRLQGIGRFALELGADAHAVDRFLAAAMWFDKGRKPTCT